MNNNKGGSSRGSLTFFTIDHSRCSESVHAMNPDSSRNPRRIQDGRHSPHRLAAEGGQVPSNRKDFTEPDSGGSKSRREVSDETLQGVDRCGIRGSVLFVVRQGTEIGTSSPFCMLRIYSCKGSIETRHVGGEHENV